jgi:hypothetical protein
MYVLIMSTRGGSNRAKGTSRHFCDCRQTSAPPQLLLSSLTYLLIYWTKYSATFPFKASGTLSLPPLGQRPKYLSGVGWHGRMTRLVSLFLAKCCLWTHKQITSHKSQRPRESGSARIGSYDFIKGSPYGSCIEVVMHRLGYAAAGG